MLAVAATYDGQKFVTEETVDFVAGQRVIITILNDHLPTSTHDNIDISKYAGSAGHLFSDYGSVDEYVRGLRDNARIRR